jgi:hypothetical protein
MNSRIVNQADDDIDRSSVLAFAAMADADLSSSQLRASVVLASSSTIYNHKIRKGE